MMTCAKCAFRTPSLAELVDHAAEHHPEITTAASRARIHYRAAYGRTRLRETSVIRIAQTPPNLWRKPGGCPAPQATNEKNSHQTHTYGGPPYCGEAQTGDTQTGSGGG